MITILLPACFFWEGLLDSLHFHEKQITSLVVNSIAFTISFVILHKFKRFPGTRSLPFIIPTLTTTWLTVFAVTVLLHIKDYEHKLMLSSYFIALLLAFTSFFLSRKYNLAKLALAPFGSALDLAENKHAITFLLKTPELPKQHLDGIVADLHAKDLPREWERFLAECILVGLPVYHAQQVLESLTGKVKTEHLSENYFGSLMPSHLYVVIKRMIDVLAVLVLLPLLTPVMLITALLIKLDDSSGGIFYLQKRMGYRGKVFTMYKFRSMRTDIKGKGFTEDDEDPRITKVGKIIRKYRIDELPQILNILKGEMSWIGPRPESMELSVWYEKDVPFFSYRHVVRPGISGWAQVSQGYAAEVEGMTVKLEHDFYYIKHFSFWLDILVFIKTIKTILTGFGSR